MRQHKIEEVTIDDANKTGEQAPVFADVVAEMVDGGWDVADMDLYGFDGEELEI